MAKKNNQFWKSEVSEWTSGKGWVFLNMGMLWPASRCKYERVLKIIIQSRIWTRTIWDFLSSKVVGYVTKLLKKGISQADIGVIAPYRRQVRLIRNMLQDMVGNAEEVKS